MSGLATPGATTAPPAIDGVFRALSDPTRRTVLERLTHGPASASELAAPFEMALPSFVEHMKTLERAGLVSSQKTGRVRTYSLVAERLRSAEDWLGRQRRLWEKRLDQLDSYLAKMKETEE